MKSMWTDVKVKWSFVGKLCGSVPIDPELISNWLEARMPKIKPVGARPMKEITKEVMDSIADENEDTEKKVTLGFQSVDGKLVMRGGTIKAHLKDCARVLSSLTMVRNKGEKSFAIKVLNSVSVVEYWIPLTRNGKAITEPDNFMDKAVHVQTMQGPRNALKKILYLEKPEMEFTLKILNDSSGKPVVSVKEIQELMEYASVHGYAGERGDGEGRYSFKLN